MPSAGINEHQPHQCRGFEGTCCAALVDLRSSVLWCMRVLPPHLWQSFQFVNVGHLYLKYAHVYSSISILITSIIFTSLECYTGVKALK